MSRAHVIVLDIETKKTFDQVGGFRNLAALGVSMVGVYSYRQDDYRAYFEKDFPELLKLLAEKPLIVGFNQRKFDMPVLQPYFEQMDLAKLPMIDILEDLIKKLGHRVKLDSVAKATLGTQKSGDGLDAIRYWNEKDFESLQKYCLDDVRITKEIFDFGVKQRKVFFTDRYGNGKLPVEVDWKLPQEEAVGQISLF